ncbi:MAG: hypothetical protein AB8B91_07070 [Rubripirellula sp.]
MKITCQRFLACTSQAIVFVASTLVFVCVVAPTPAISAPPQEVDDSIAQWNLYFEHVADEYQLSAGVDSPRGLQLVKTPVLNYTNPVSERQQHGSI